MKYCLLLLSFFPSLLLSQKIDTLHINSKVLGRTIEIFTLNYSQGNDTPIFYLTDGKKMLDNHTGKVIDSLSSKGLIPKSKYIFVSTIDPKTKQDYREEYFFCNEQFVHFFEKELVPKMEGKPKVNQQRYLVGVSFGGMNTAFFAAQTNSFHGFAMLSPITYPCKYLNQTLVFSNHQNYKVYISTGELDAESYIETLLPILQSKTHHIKFVKTKGGHDFHNWNNQMLGIISFMNN